VPGRHGSIGMPHAWQALRSGSWLTPARGRGYSLILLAIAALAILGWIALSDGLVDRNGKPIGTDFSSFYAAGALALEGKAADAYRMAAHYAREQQLFGANTPYYGWLYPPIFFVFAAPLALLPYRWRSPSGRARRLRCIWQSLLQSCTGHGAEMA
jgi:alpha-1,2-mannosyltransferase